MDKNPDTDLLVPTYIRPSALALAEQCGLSVHLAREFPEATPAATKGNAVHAEIEEWIKVRNEAKRDDQVGEDARKVIAMIEHLPVTREAQGAANFLSGFETWKLIPEKKVQLRDPESGDLITQGTPDVVAVSPDRPGERREVVVIDWKSGFAPYIDGPDQALQLLAYLAAAMIEHSADQGRVYIAKRLGHPKYESIQGGQTWQASEVWGIIDRIKTVHKKERVAIKGLHCRGCYSRLHCSAWTLPAYEGEENALVPMSEMRALTNDERVKIVLACKALHEVADNVLDKIKAEVEAGAEIEHDGKRFGPVMMPGRRSAKVDDLITAGLQEFVKEGEPFETWRWLKVKK